MLEMDTGLEQNLSVVDVITTSCRHKSYCCGFNATPCCKKNAGYLVANGKVTRYQGETLSESNKYN
jgi:hypothetical protein